MLSACSQKHRYTRGGPDLSAAAPEGRDIGGCSLRIEQMNSSRLQARLAGHLGRTGQGLVLAHLFWGFANLSPAGQTGASSGTDTNLPLLVRASQIRGLSASEAARQYPVRLIGVLTYYNPARYLRFVQDDSCGIYFDPAPSGEPLLRAGQKVEIEGMSDPGEFAPIIRAAHIRTLGEGPMPKPTIVTLRTLLTGEQDSQWVAVRGVVRNQYVESGDTILALAADNASVRVIVPNAARQPAPVNLVDASVEVGGVCSTRFDARRRLRGVELNVPGWAQLEVTMAPPPNPLKLPPRPINELLQFHGGTNGFHRSHIQGQVTLRQGDGSFFLQDGTGGILVQAQQPAKAVQVGDAVGAVGFAAIVDGLPAFQEGVVTNVSSRAAAVTPVRLPPDSPLNEEYHGALVRLEGRVISHSARTTEESLTLQFGPRVTDAILDKENAKAQLAAMVPGCLVGVTGVYLARLDEDLKVRSFQLRLRSPGDVAVLSWPPWWTTRRAVWVLGGLGALLLISLGWVRLLHRQVRQQTQELRDEINERKEKQEALSKSEERWRLLASALEESRGLLRALLDNMPDAAWLKDTQGRYRACNQRLAICFGRKPDDLVGRTLHDFVPEIADRLAHEDGEVMEMRRALRSEAELPGPSGKDQWFEVVRSPTFDEHGTVTGTVGISHDITERKRTELRVAAFSALGHELSAATTTKEAAQIVMDIADQLIGWDACLCDSYSAPEDTVLRVLTTDIVDGRRAECPPMREQTPPSALARRAIQQGGLLLLRDQADLVRPDAEPLRDGARPSASILYVPIRDGGTVIGLLSIQSYTPNAYDRKSLETLQALADHCAGAWGRIRTQAEHIALEEAQRRLATAVEQSAESIVITDVQGTILYVNPAFERTTGYSRVEALGKNPRILKTGKHNLAFYREMWAALTRGEAWRGRLINKRKDGVNFEEDVVITPIRDGAGKITNYVAVKHDVSVEVQLGAQLRQSQKMEAVGQLAGGIAHDFNNLLAVMRGNTELALMMCPQLSAETRECLSQVVAAAERASNLTRQLLAFGRKQVMESRPVNLNVLVGNIAKMLKRIIGEDILLQCNHCPQLPFVQADPGMLEQVLVNLVVNARDAMPGGGQLTISTEVAQLDAAYASAHAEARAGCFVRLSVADSGTGIAPDVLPRIFEPFFTTKEVGRGSGLGLAMVYGIVKQHQGWIEVASEPGAGSVFRIFLPDARISAPVSTGPLVESKPPGGTEAILLVEDDETVRSFMCRLLGRHGYLVHQAASGREALERWHDGAGEAKLLLTDVIMPGGITGFELASQLRAQRPALRVIVMSGYNGDGAAGHAGFDKAAGIRFLQKPCAARELLLAIRQALDQKD